MALTVFSPDQEPSPYLLIDGGTGERRDVKNHPTAKGHLSFVPDKGAKPYYLIYVDAEGYEILLEVFHDHTSAAAAADFHWHDYGTALLVDATKNPVSTKIYTSADIPTMQ